LESAPPNVIKNGVSKNKKRGENNRRNFKWLKKSAGRNKIEIQLENETE